MGYYQQLEPLVLEVLHLNQDHFTQHDQKELEDYAGEFLLAVRMDGTDLCLLDNQQFEFKSDTEIQLQLDLSYNHLFHNGNTIFFYGKDGNIQKIARLHAIEILKQYAHQVRAICSVSTSLTN